MHVCIYNTCINVFIYINPYLYRTHLFHFIDFLFQLSHLFSAMNIYFLRLCLSCFALYYKFIFLCFPVTHDSVCDYMSVGDFFLLFFYLIYFILEIILFTDFLGETCWGMLNNIDTNTHMHTHRNADRHLDTDTHTLS